MAIRGPQVRDRTKRPLFAILLGFTLLGLVYSAGVPIFEASDEVWHYPMVQHLARTWTLPVQPLEPGASGGPWRQEASQPPLYYALAAALTAWIDTSDLEQVRHLNPHVAAGEVTPDGSNVNLVVHNPASERFPWRGTVLAVHIARFFSVLLGTWAVYLTWAIVRELFPDRPRLALTAAAIHAFTPMYLFISASVNNDNLVVPLCSLALLMMIRRIKDEEWRMKSAVKIRSHLRLGVVMGLGLLTKASAIALLPLAVATIAWEAWQSLNGRMVSCKLRVATCESPPTPQLSMPNYVVRFMFHALRNLCLVLLPALAIAGWWFYRNYRLYGDWLGLNAFYAVLGTRDVAADLTQLWAERFAFAAGYWGNFGGLNVPMPTWIYTALNAFAILAALNLTIRFVLWVVGGKSNLWPFSWDNLTAARALAWAWPAAVFVSWIRWATITWSSQGRLIFSAMPMWSLALAMVSDEERGARSKWRMTNYVLRFTRRLPQLLAAFLLMLCLVALPLWIVPAYRPPRATQVELNTPPLRADFGNVLRLTGFKIDRRNTMPGDSVELTLQWTVLAPTTADHSLFIHVLGEGERIIAQRDTFPGKGLLSTTWLAAGHTWIEHYEIPIPALAYTPDDLSLAVGMYETATGTRLTVQAEAPLTVARDAVRFGDVRLGKGAQFPALRFGKGIVLNGYDLDKVVVARGETLALTLFWACAARIDGDYTISVQLIDEQWRKAAQSDTWPLNGAAPTSTWRVGQRFDELRALNIDPHAQPGVYNMQLAAYRLTAEGTLEHLPIVWEKGQMPVKTVVLTRVRID